MSKNNTNKNNTYKGVGLSECVCVSVMFVRRKAILCIRKLLNSSTCSAPYKTNIIFDQSVLKVRQGSFLSQVRIAALQVIYWIC